jgi:iron complex transport system substrate-binding protein
MNKEKLEELRKVSKEYIKEERRVLQDQCEVCAVSLDQVEKSVSELTNKKVKVVSLKPHCLDDVYRDIFRVGEVLDARGEAEKLIQSLKLRAQTLRDSILPKKPKVLALEWLNPPMIGGGWIPELIDMAGGIPLGVEKPQKFRTVTLNEVESYQADIICAFPCGFSIEKTMQELNLEDNKKEFSQLSASHRGHFYVLDGNHYFNRSGPRLIDSAEILAKLFRAPKRQDIPRLWVEYHKETP